MSDGLKFLSAVLQAGSPGTLLEVGPEMFLENETDAYEFVKRHFRAYRELPTRQTVQAETGARLPDVREALQYYVDGLNDRYEYNQIRESYEDFREQLSAKNMPGVNETVATMSRVLRRRRTTANSIVTLDEGMRLVGQRLDSIVGTGGVSGITTGWHRFDSITGGYQNADLITWVGRMGMGKTYVALYQAYQAYLNGESVIFVTTEMGTEQIARRAVSIALGINPTVLKNGNISTHMRRRIQAFAEELVGMDRFRIFSVGMNSKVSAIEALVQEFGPSVVFIDGVYLLRPTEGSKSMNRTEKITGVYDEIKGLTLDSDTPFIAMSQFNRQAGKQGKEGSLETIGYTDAIGTHSSIVVAIKNGPTTKPSESRAFDFLKGREGESGEVAINFKFAPLDMNEMTEEETADAVGYTNEETSVDWMGV